MVDEIAAKARKSRVVAAHIDQFDEFFDAVVAVKEGLGIINSAAALSAMAELAIEGLAEIESVTDDTTP